MQKTAAKKDINKWEAARRQTKRDKRAVKFKKILMLLGCTLLVVLLLTSPIFHVTVISVTGNETVTAQEIYNAGVKEGENIFSVNAARCKQLLLQNNPYIKNVEIKKMYPDKITVAVTERKARGYIEYKSANSYILIDETGMVLDIVPYTMDGSLPVIVGVSFQSHAVGKTLDVTDAKAFDAVVLFASLFEKYELENVTRIDVSDLNDIHIWVGLWDVLFGGMDEADEKMMLLTASLLEASQSETSDLSSFPGTFDIRKPKNGGVFSFIY